MDASWLFYDTTTALCTRLVVVEVERPAAEVRLDHAWLPGLHSDAEGFELVVALATESQTGQAPGDAAVG